MVNKLTLIMAFVAALLMTAPLYGEGGDVSEIEPPVIPELNFDVGEIWSADWGVKSTVSYSLNAKVDQTVHKPRYSEILHDKWREATTALAEKNYRDLNAHLIALDELKIEHGLDALEEYSLYLLAAARREISSRDENKRVRQEQLENAAFLARKAIQLSPNSPPVLFKALRFVPYIHGESVWHLLRRIFSASWYRPHLILSIINKSIYPFLWALTLGIYITLVMFFSYNIKQLLIETAAAFPASISGLFAPAFCLGFLLFPCMLGPLWCVFLWGSYILLFFPSKKWISFFAGVVLVLWGALIPIRETLNGWLGDNSIQTMLRVSGGDFGVYDKPEIEKLTELRSEDGVVFFVYGQLLKRLGKLEEAKEAFLTSEMLFGKETPWTRAQLGIVAYLQGNMKEADNIFKKAEEMGMNSAEFNFNYSKVKFALMDTVASRDYYLKANKKDPELVKYLSDREGILGVNSNKALAEIRLPMSRILSSAMNPLVGGANQQDSIADLIMMGLNPILISLCGLILIGWFLFGSGTRRQRGYLADYISGESPGVLKLLFRIIPGGSWVMCGRPASSFVLISLLVFLLMPLTAWPVKFFILEPGQSIFFYYIALLVLLILAVVGMGAYSCEAE